MRLSERINQGLTSNLLESINTNLNEGTNKKRVARYHAFDNGRILHSWYDWTEEEAQEKAKQASTKDTNSIYYVDYDDVMGDGASYGWYQGEKISWDEFDKIQNELDKNKSLTEDENNDVDIVSYNLTNGGYSNNANTVYGKLSDDTAYVYYPEMDLIEIYDEVPIELLHILYYNSENEDELPEDEYQRLVKEYQDAHLINTIHDGPLFDKLHDKYYADDEVEEVYSDLDESVTASKYAKFCKSMELDPKDLDEVLEALDNLEGMDGDASGEYQEIREYIYNDLMK